LDVNKPNALQENLHLRASMSQALTEAVGELPTAKYLVQKSEGAISNEIYRQLIDAVYSAEEEIPSGQGAEYFLMNGMTVNALDENKFIPDSRNDIDNYLYVDAIEIPGEIKQDELTIAT
jgi:hypothetical protein